MTDLPDWWRGQVPPARSPGGLSPGELVTGEVSAVKSSDLILDTPLRRLVGRTRPGHRSRCGGRNVIHGNDFTGTRFTDNVGWRRDFPLDDQRWPAGFTPLVDD